MKRFLTSQDVQSHKQLGHTTITVTPDTVITGMARDVAGYLGVVIKVSPEGEAADATGAALGTTGHGDGGDLEAGVQARDPRCTLDLVVSGGRVVIPGVGVLRTDIGIADGQVVGLGPLEGAGRERVDAAGRYVLPGIVDPHVHLGMAAPFQTEVRTETRSALLGGVTTIGLFVGGRESHLETLPDLERAAAGGAATDIFPHLCLFTDGQREEIETYVRQCGVTSFKLYLAGIPGLIDPVDDAFMVDTFERLRFLGAKAVVCIHAENESIVSRATANLQAEDREADLARWSLSHPGLAEEEAVSRAALLAARTGVSVYFVHLNTVPGLTALRRARAERLTACPGTMPECGSEPPPAILAETTSAYLTVTDDSPLGAVAKMTPPFRDRATVDALWRAVFDGTIDTLGTDNVTMTLDEKSAGRGVWGAMPGFPALATHLPVMLDAGVGGRGLPLLRLAELMSRNPARVFGLYPRKGTLLPGSDADLVIIDLERTRQVQPNELQSRADFSLYQGQALKGWPVMTIKGGRVVARDGRLVEAEPPSGRWLRRLPQALE